MATDFRTSNLASIRTQFSGLVRRKQNGVAAEYRGEDDDTRTPRAEGGYRLPPLPFGEPASQNSDHSVPRSLTPITERTDIYVGSRTNSTRTAKSGFLVNERQPSGSSTKQNSVGSTKHQPTSTAAQEDRLAPISDSTEAIGQYTEEPAEHQHEESPMPATKTPAITPTMSDDGSTAQTAWSQSTGETPTQQHLDRTTPNHAQPRQIPAPLRTSPLPGPEFDLPDLPSATSTNGPVVGGRILSPVHKDPTVLSPTPRRPSAGEKSPTGSPLQDEPAAMYLMNMVEKNPQNSTSQAGAASSQEEERSPERVRPTIVTAVETSTQQQKPIADLGRKPSGARAAPPKKLSGSRGLGPVGGEERRDRSIENEYEPDRLPSSDSQPDLGEDASAFVAYADQPSPAKPRPQYTGLSPALPYQSEMRSSFALSTLANERRAKAEHAAADQQRAQTIPGGGKRSGQADTWSVSEDEEEGDGSPVASTRPDPSRSTQPRQVSPPPHVQRVLSQTRALPAIPRTSSMNMVDSDDHLQNGPQPQADRLAARSPKPNETQPFVQNRQTVWNANFSADHGMNENKSGKFVDLGEPSAQLTKAFAPHGLLQAGMQDKEERSAKRQEETARETGNSLINVSSKPPPPQTGLLGAVAAHERDRKNAGGIGATLTDRERERRQGVSGQAATYPHANAA